MIDNNDSYETEIKDPPEREINTFDSPLSPLSFDRGTLPPKKKGNFWGGLYKFVATTVVALTVIFSASELIDFMISDMDAGNALLRRVFGSSASGNSGDLFHLILEQSFGNLETPATESNEPLEPPSTPPLTSPPYSTPESPVETSPSTPPETIPNIPENAHPIISMDMSLLSYGEEFIYNNTALSPSVSTIASSALKRIEYSNGPLVLVIHTHGTEAYMDDGATYYTDDGELARSSDTEKNMIAVGAEFVNALESHGIETLHCTVMHDKESYRESYSRSAETIKWYLEQYPSIKYVFDLHRDSIMKSDESLVSAITSIEGERYAQIMPVVGSGYVGYEDNLVFALKLRGLLNSKHGALGRPVCLRESQYNQSLSPVSILLEIGTSGNTLEEAKRSAILTADAVAELIKEQTK